MSHLQKSIPSLANVKDYGATGDGTTDDTAAIQAAFDDLVNPELGGVFFPAGTYRIGYTTIDCLSGRITDILILGAGSSSILKYLDGNMGGANVRMLDVGNSSGKQVVIRDLVLDGNRGNITNGNSSTTLLYGLGTDALHVENCALKNSVGFAIWSDSGIGTLIKSCSFSNNYSVSARVWSTVGAVVDGCYFDDHPTGNSVAISINNSESLRVVNCIILHDQGGTNGKAIDGTGCTNLLIENCISQGRHSLGSTQICITGCYVSLANAGHVVLPVSVSDSLIIDSSIIEGQSYAVQITGGGSKAIISGSILTCGSGPIVRLTTTAVDDLSITGCVFVEGGGSEAISLINPNDALESLLISDNIFSGPFDNSPIVLGGATVAVTMFGPFAIVDNSFRDPKAGVSEAIAFVAGSGPLSFDLIPVISNNHCEYDSLIDSADLALFDEPCYIAGGGGGPIAGSAGLQNAGTQFVGTGTPEGNVTGYPGDTFQRLDGGIGSTHYIKESGAGTNTGWVAGDSYSPPEKWNQDNVAAAQSGVALNALVSTNFNTIKAVRDGSIVGLSTRLSETLTDATADSALVQVTINGVKGTLQLSHSSGTNPDGGEATQAAGIDTFSAGDTLGIVITTLGSFAPTTTDIEAWLDIVGG